MLLMLFVITFLESVAGALLQRGLYFYTHEVLDFSETNNLWLAFGFGVIYVVGAFGSHHLARRVGERGLLLASLGSLAALHLLLAFFPSPTLLVAGVFGTALIQGLKWPVVESYVSAGRSPTELLSVLSRYNVVWASACFVAVGVTGVMVGGERPALFFWLPAGLNLAALALSLRLPRAPGHLDQAHPARPSRGELDRMRTLLGSARWSMTGSYALLFVLAPLMPSMLSQLRLPLAMATPVASALDAVRVLCFASLGVYTGWRGRSLPLWLCLIALPVGFWLILLGGSLPSLLLGEALFGFAAGFAYTASLYYALVSENASVDAGGAHEGLIGLGLGLGPLSGLLGQLLMGQTLPGGGPMGMLGPFTAFGIAAAPVIALCAAGAVRALLKLRGRPA